jgi:pSer/pThr/pTyr-binding forkhead associated (FHA) protein
MPARLVALNEGPDIPLDRDPILVGRHPSCAIRLPSTVVSRRHCCLALVDGQMVVIDLGSYNGVLINGHRVEMGRLRPGDELSIANHRFRLEVRLQEEGTPVAVPTRV